MRHGIVAYPTDTVWGIGCNIAYLNDCKRVMEIKNSSFDKPVSVLFSSVDLLCQYVDLDSIFSRKWLERFFTLETTLCVSKDFIIDHKIPSYIYKDSALVGVRCLDLRPIQKMLIEVGGPVITTSLNFSGDDPILTTDDARKFVAQFSGEIQIYPGINDSDLSGHSSTIVVYDHLKKSFSYLREGFLASEVREHCGLFTA